MLNPDEVNNTTRSWEVFANHYKTPGNTVRWDSNVSLESWHDDIHVLVGTGDGYAGHMTKVPVAGVGLFRVSLRKYLLMFAVV